ncbi:unnamed protein product [Sphagnum jensenii]|uniref:Uncharacterized protein n=1 Tax=Sphagnum jensenii TaxID=128206 RepID=A0ABP0ZXH7_9BRYO
MGPNKALLTAQCPVLRPDVYLMAHQAHNCLRMLEDGALLGLYDSFQRQVHQGSAERVQLPFQDREVALDRRRVGKDGREATTECAETFEPGDTVPCVIEQRIDVVLVNHVPHVLVITIHLH